MTVAISHTVVSTDIPLPPGSDDGLVAAVEVRVGRAVVVIAEHASGCMGIGHAVQRVGDGDLSTRNRCLEHALARIANLMAQRHEQRAARAGVHRRVRAP